jgi:glyoxylase-like metal-dependent hydrolase (beta-lactamase superfamily II)
MRTKTFSLCAVIAGIFTGSLGVQSAMAQSLGTDNGNAALPYMEDHASDVLPANLARVVGSVSILEVRPDVYMLTVDGNNLAVFTGLQGSLVIDSGAGRCDDVVRAVNSITKAPVRYIVLTGPAADRVGCSGALRDAGARMPAAYVSQTDAEIIGHQTIALRMGEQTALPSTASVPGHMYTRSTLGFALNDQSIQVISVPAAHTDGDSVVLLRRSDVVVTGNVFDMTRFPVIDIEHGGSIQGELVALNRLLTDLVVPSTPKWEGRYGTLVIPARGHLSNQTDIVLYRDMITIIRDRIAALIAEGKSLAQVQAADPTRGYAPRFGAETGPWTTRDFVAAVYKSLTADRRVKRKRG